MSHCKRCNCAIEDETLKHTYYNPEYPDIDIGPYCIDCISLVRVCSGCHHPFIDGEDIKYFGECQHYCDTCAADITSCDHCGKIRTIHKTVGGISYCEECFTRNFKECDCCGQVKQKVEFEFGRTYKARKRAMFDEYPSICLACSARIEDDYDTVEVRECAHCLDIYGITPTSHDKYCQNCVEALPKCTHCGETTMHGKTCTIVNKSGGDDYGILCEVCIKKHRKCTSCGAYTKNWKTLHGKVGHAHVCNNCISRGLDECPQCLKMAVLAVNGVCGHCNENYNGNKCNCGSVRDHEGRCRICTDHKHRVYNYTLKPHPYFHYTPRDEKSGDFIFFGIENEVYVEGSTQCRSTLTRLYANYDPTVLVAKSDASINGYGYEIVTQPMTLNYFNKMDVTKMFSRSYKQSSSCGMHVHVGRNAFQNDLHLFKVTNFIHNNREEMDTIAGRTYNTYSRELTKKVSEVIVEYKKHKHAERHVRVNLRNEKTVEFRMFAGATKEYEMRYRVEFLHALISYTRDLSLQDTDINKFFDYVASNNHQYENFAKFIKKEWRIS